MGLFKKKKAGLPASTREQFLAENVPALLRATRMFQADFLMFVSAELLAGRIVCKIPEGALLPGASLNEAMGALNRCLLLASMHFDRCVQLVQFQEAGARYVVVETGSICVGCPFAPTKKKWKPADAPVLPCMHCKKDRFANIWYKAEF